MLNPVIIFLDFTKKIERLLTAEIIPLNKCTLHQVSYVFNNKF